MNRILRSILIAVAFVIIALTAFPSAVFANEYKPRLTAPDGEPYYTRALNVYSQAGYGMPNCAAYAYGRIYELNGEAPRITGGDAGDWWFINKRNAYYEYGDEARLGAVACWSNHVAVVEEIDGGAVTVSESHWGGSYFNTKTYYNMYSHYGQSFYGYIYAYTPAEEASPSYKMEPSYFAPQEKTCFTALEFAMSDNNIMNPNNNPIFNQ